MSTCEHPGCATHPDDNWEQLREWATHHLTHYLTLENKQQTIAYIKMIDAMDDLEQETQ